MPFTPKVWKDAPDHTTPLSAAALVDLETRLAAYTDALSTAVVSTSPTLTATNRIVAQNATTIPLTTRAAVGQTSDLFAVEDSAGVQLTRVLSDGSVRVGKGGAFSQIQLAAGTGAVACLPASATNVPFSSTVAGETSASWQVDARGKVQWGPGGSAALDTNLYRNAVGQLATDSLFAANGGATATYVSPAGLVNCYAAATTNSSFQSQVSGDTQSRFVIRTDGYLAWGSGSAVQDTNLYRATTATLKTDNTLIVAVSSSASNATTWPLQTALTDTATAASSTSLKNALQAAYVKTGSAADTGYAAGSGIFGTTIQGGSSQDVWDLQSRITVNSGATITTASHFVADAQYGTTGTITSRRGFYVRDINRAAGQTVTNQYGLYVDALSSATNQFAIYLAGTGSANGITFGTDTNLFRSSTGTLTTGGDFKAQGSVVVNNGDGTGKVFFGSALDTNLYRSGTGTLKTDGALALVGNVGFYNTAPQAKQTVTGSRGANAALASLLTALATLGLLTDSSTA